MNIFFFYLLCGFERFHLSLEETRLDQRIFFVSKACIGRLLSSLTICYFHAKQLKNVKTVVKVHSTSGLQLIIIYINKNNFFFSLFPTKQFLGKY